MNFASWLTKISDFVSLGSIVTNGGPGMLFALSLLLIGSQILGVPLFLLRHDDFPKRSDSGTIDAKHEQVIDAEEQTSVRESEKAFIEAQIAEVNQDLNALNASIDKAMDQSVAEVRTRMLEGKRKDKRKELDDLMRKKANAEGTLASQRRQLEAARKELDDLRANQVVTATNLLDNALSHLLGITLVGYILGSLLSPINRILFLDWPDEWLE
jgi:hypothetical protein